MALESVALFSAAEMLTLVSVQYEQRVDNQRRQWAMGCSDCFINAVGLHYQPDVIWSYGGRHPFRLAAKRAFTRAFGGYPCHGYGYDAYKADTKHCKYGWKDLAGWLFKQSSHWGHWRC